MYRWRSCSSPLSWHGSIATSVCRNDRFALDSRELTSVAKPLLTWSHAWHKVGVSRLIRLPRRARVLIVDVVPVVFPGLNTKALRTRRLVMQQHTANDSFLACFMQLRGTTGEERPRPATYYPRTGVFGVNCRRYNAVLARL